MTGGTLALFARNEPGVLHADLAACTAWTSGPDAARKVRCPALVVIAANDIMTPPKTGQELARLIAGSRTVTIAGLRPHAAGGGARRGARCADRICGAGEGGLGGKRPSQGGRRHGRAELGRLGLGGRRGVRRHRTEAIQRELAQHLVGGLDLLARAVLHVGQHLDAQEAALERSA